MTISSPARPAGAATPAEPVGHPAALTALLLATFMGFLDLFIVNVAAPSVQHDLSASFAELQLVLSGYIVAYAVGLVTGGRLGDTYGQRRLWLSGIVAFVVASVACGVAPGIWLLIGARVVQGFAAAVMLPQVLASIQILYPPGERRGRALSTYGAVIGLASLSGQIVGGALIEADLAGSGWRSVFFVNVPIGLAALAIGARTVPAARLPSPAPLDVAGAGFLGAAIVLTLYPVVAGGASGWSVPLVAMVVAGLACFGAFFAWERRLEADPAREPLLRPSLLRLPGPRWGLPVVLAFYAGNSGFFLVLAYFLQDGLKLSPLGSGLGFLPLGAGFAAASLASRAAVARFGLRAQLAGVMLIVFGLLAALPASRGSSADFQLIVPLALAGLGEGLIAAPIIGVVLRDVPPEAAGSASGALLTTTQIANILSVAVTGVIFNGLLGSAPGRHDYDTAFAGALIWLLVLAVLTGALFLGLGRAQRRP
ncbi:MFS transporter [Frankia sp. R82]|uniref:MFS transporter n=1 Tax=Frankia sp. R82 TaxID=2950553 RepID=UPI00204328E2|nr:MFS transporter [Frankia sp. R82]MCM3882417.1 MFS transporter [Frankia sp. R82]